MFRLRFYAVPAVLLLCCGCGSPEKGRPESKAAPTPVKITQFYASPSLLARGEKTLVCYGVENANDVRIEPEIEPVRPSPNRCLEFRPRRGGTYKLTASGDGGTRAQASLTIVVREPSAKTAPQAEAPHLIQTFAASADSVLPGQPVTLCYAAENAESVRLEPAAGVEVRTGRSCVTVTPQRTTTYTLTASAAGTSEQEKVTVRVR